MSSVGDVVTVSHRLLLKLTLGNTEVHIEHTELTGEQPPSCLVAPLPLVTESMALGYTGELNKPSLKLEFECFSTYFELYDELVPTYPEIAEG